LRINPRDAEVHYDFGNLLLRGRQLLDAIEEFKEAVRLRPGYAEARDNLGGALLETGRPQEAIVQYQEALRLKPDLVEARVNLGSALLETNRPEDAIASYRAALLIRPTTRPPITTWALPCARWGASKRPPPNSTWRRNSKRAVTAAKWVFFCTSFFCWRRKGGQSDSSATDG